MLTENQDGQWRLWRRRKQIQWHPSPFAPAAVVGSPSTAHLTNDFAKFYTTGGGAPYRKTRSARKNIKNFDNADMGILVHCTPSPIACRQSPALCWPLKPSSTRSIQPSPFNAHGDTSSAKVIHFLLSSQFCPDTTRPLFHFYDSYSNDIPSAISHCAISANSL